MLVIRMQRSGRKGHAQFRVVVQDSRRTPTSGKVVAALGHFNPHTKETSLNKEKASFYLEHGAQPSERVIRLLKSEGVKLPKWVSKPDKKEGKVRNPEKRRSTAPPEPKEPVAEKPAEEAATTSSDESAETETAEPTEIAEAEAEVVESTEAAEEVAAEAEAETTEPSVSTEQLAESEEAKAETAAKADEADATDET